jgi:structural maintenance of chromosome 2
LIAKGYEDRDEITITRQVVIGGKNKYMINGITVQNTRVADLFKSVQLNVNNPHFLIMQVCKTLVSQGSMSRE